MCCYGKDLEGKIFENLAQLHIGSHITFRFLDLVYLSLFQIDLFSRILVFWYFRAFIFQCQDLNRWMATLSVCLYVYRLSAHCCVTPVFRCSASSFRGGP